MPAETERTSDPTANEPTTPTDPSKAAPEADPGPKRTRLNRLLKRSTRRTTNAPDDDGAADRAASNGSTDVAIDGTTTEDTARDEVEPHDEADKDEASKDEASKDKTSKDASGQQQPTATDREVSPDVPSDEPDSEPESEPAQVPTDASSTEGAAVSENTDATTSESAAVDPAASSDTRRVWRCSRSTIILVIVLMVVIGIAIPAAAALSLKLGVTGFGDQQVLVLSVLGGLALLTLLFGWRLALHPRLVADGPELRVVNPFRTHRLDFSDITHFAPGGDGLMVGTAEAEIDAWCIQKSTGAIKAERHTRADKITDELWKIRDGYHRPIEQDDEPHPAEIRFAHQDDAELLTQLERSASLARLGHIFPPDRYGFPEDDIRQRWQAVLADRTRQTMIAEIGGEPAGYVSIGIETIHHMGVAEGYQRQGIGSELMAAAEDELFADVATPEIDLWVLEDNEVARSFYRAHGWTETEDERDAEFPPYPNEIRMLRRNPHLARRGR